MSRAVGSLVVVSLACLLLCIFVCTIFMYEICDDVLIETFSVIHNQAYQETWEYIRTRRVYSPDILRFHREAARTFRRLARIVLLSHCFSPEESQRLCSHLFILHKSCTDTLERIRSVFAPQSLRVQPVNV